ncbi:CPBP family intramembrane glutamic endopeptidase [Prevotella sp. tf2-5]|uniref:CPBP family intramembrane glutamic endopeptidase n=1 Tax=Prevotella sp. tf2-5 TaxID=1761889 RepID=UPI0008E3F288|nr:type II CAAX endopeptidase family protein [Prevotella sp. tf2-5]SFO70088.1 hypothetical protein SAMN04487852_105155 [Prevotella sp. tf2-5]
MKNIINAFVYALIFVAIQAMAGIVVHFVWQQVVGGTDITVMELVATIAVFSLLTIIIFLSARWAEISPNWLLTKQWDVMMWAVLAALGMVIPMTWLQENMPELPNWIENEQEQLLSNYWGYLAIGLLAPLAEEIVFRGAILRTLLEWNNRQPVGPIMISAVLFSLIHMNPAQMPYAFLAGFLLGWMYWRTGSILPGMAYHWANNSVAYILFRAYPDQDMKLIDIFKGSELHVYLAVFFSLLICLPALYQLHLRMRRAV